MSRRSVRIGCATAWSGDRFEPATVLANDGDLDYLFFESMSETTMSGARVDAEERPDQPGYDPLLVARIGPILETCVANGTRIISNQGWLDPAGAAERVLQVAESKGLHGLRVAAVTMDGMTEQLDRSIRNGALKGIDPLAIVSAEPYLGARGISAALDAGADVVLTTRVTDSSLVLGPLVHEFGWSWDDFDRLSHGVVVGHLLECGPQVSGGNICDPGYFDVPGLLDIGHPIAEVSPSGTVITKVAGTGGLITETTCAAQLLWEVGDPSRYITPDVIADFTDISFHAIDKDVVEVRGGRGLQPTGTLKTLVGVREGFFTEEMILFAGLGALEKARLTESLVRERLRALDFRADALRIDFVGVNAIHREATEALADTTNEVALRVAARCATSDEINKIGRVVAPMAVSGPVGTGKWGTLARKVRPVIGMHAVLIPADAVTEKVTIFPGMVVQARD